MSLKFKRPWVQYPEPKANIKQGKSMTVPGQSIPMSTMISRYMSGQIFGLSMNQTYYDTDSDDIDAFEGRYSPDPDDFCAPERALLEHKSIQQQFKKAKDEKVKNVVEDGFRGEEQPANKQLSPET